MHFEEKVFFRRWAKAVQEGNKEEERLAMEAWDEWWDNYDPYTRMWVMCQG
jgi:hypothetical protein